MSKKYKKVVDRFSDTDVGVLIEEFTSQIKFIGEGVLGLNDKVDKIDARLGRVEDDIGVIKMDIEIIKHDLKNKIGRDEFAILERRVALLENRT
jgi:hypothetical protein